MTQRSRIAIAALFVMLVLPAALFAQGTTGQLTGNVTQNGAPLPGVTVTVSSPNLQGTRTTVTNENGAYNFGALPPGNYTVTYSLEGMQTVTKKANVGLLQASRADADLKMTAVAEAITVTASSPTVLETTQVETNVKQAEVNRLPINRNPVAIANLAPGTSGNGVNGTVISGAMSYDNLWLVNGAVVNENLRGQPHQLYIEDAIQETTVLQGGVSAEYGRFTGGVVSSITKSGGNEFSGSIRDTLNNETWTSKSVPTQVRGNKILPTYEATLGGRIIRDRLWFFLAGRKQDDTRETPFTLVKAGTQLTNPAFPQQNTRHRYEGKLTGQITSKHSLVASYMNNQINQTNNCQFGCLDSLTLAPQQQNPNNFKTVHYNGIITNSFLIEADWAKKYFAFVNSGGTQPYGDTGKSAADLSAGTPVLDNVITGAYGNAPYFCGTCGPETRNNNEWEVKGRYFLGTRALGTHNAVFGYDNWAEQRKSNNFQSPTNFRFNLQNTAPVQNADGTISMTVHGDPSTGDLWVYFPIAYLSQGSDLQTKSIFLNDKWDLNPHFSFNLGARWDKNHALDSFHNVVSNDSAISPRLGAIYDVFGNGKLRVDANYGEYVGRLAETVAGLGSAAGSPASIVFRYAGPDIPMMDSRAALEQAFSWLLANGYTSRTPSQNPSIPGFNRRLSGSIKSPNMRETTVGAGTQIGRGFVRADIIHRNWRDFYGQFVNLGIGQVTSPVGVKADLILVGNTNLPTRTYNAAQVQGQYQFTNNFGLGANYTYSKLRGNTQGETSGGGPVTFASLSTQYAQYQDFEQNAPTGWLSEDQRHKARAWLDYGIGTPIGKFTLGALERFESGLPYSASAAIPIRQSASFPTGIVNPGYAAPPTTVTYFFSARGAYRAANLIATDLSVNYDLPVGRAAIFVKGELRNALNHKAVINPVQMNATVYTAANANRGLVAFNPFTTATPIECPQGSTAATCSAMGANWMKDVNFGQPNGTATTLLTAGSYQLPRTYLFSLGARF
ncbi:MAG TPA: TonB-dependent receptor [Thermoanaerobaculia bacterium]|nr:TonB-dependent receptor [Thermoanaerobaculia bacterium]